MGYPAPKTRTWAVQVEFLDGTTIDAISDEDALERWQRLAVWWDPTVEVDPIAWRGRVLDRAREFYSARLPGVTSESSPTEILEALDTENCLSLRRK